jgi:FMN reductase
MANIVALTGSPSESSRSAAVVQYIQAEALQAGYSFQTIHIRELDASDLLLARIQNPGLFAAHEQIREAQAVIIATPIYKATYSGLLKVFLDTLSQYALADKIVLPIATGGSPAHLLAIDYGLKPVLTALGAEHILRGLYLVDSQIKYVDGGLQIDPEIATRLHDVTRSLLKRITLTELVPATAE